MKVTLLNSYFNEDVAKLATANCVGKIDEPLSDKGLQVAIDSKHYSVLEHLPLTFLVRDVSRITEVQLVRHRIASYSIKSGRYTKADNTNLWYQIPKSISNNDSIMESFIKMNEDIYSFYTKMVEQGIPKEDARYILPQGLLTDIVVSMNARAFIEQCEKRLCKKAQWEIREMYTQMKECIKYIYPTVYEQLGPPCIKGKCTEVYSCKK